MAATDIEQAQIWEDNDCTCMARFTVNGSNGTQSDIASVSRKIFDRKSGTSGNASALTVASVVFDTLQTDGRWTKDTTGYNFRDRIAGTNFPTGDTRYVIEYQFTGASSEKFMLVYEVTTLEILTS
jgi:hypothetical protein